MEAQGRRNIVVVAPDDDDGSALAQLVSDSSAAWTCSRISPGEVGSHTDALVGASAIVVTTEGNEDRAVADALPENVPVIACGSIPPSSSKPVSWLQRPSAALLRTLLHDTFREVESTDASSGSAPAPPPLPRLSSIPPPSSTSGARWRRKSDVIIGRSRAVRELLAALDRIASSSATVCITGESGTGKELVARALHYSSPRCDAPFIALNCAAIPEPLFEAELFGYARGAFTGAVSARVGAFEAAAGGTLFLDEIGEMPRTMQPKLLRVLERGEVVRLGTNESRTVSVRVVAATNRDPEAEVQAGNFREDLYFRLRVCQIHVPPLRDRLEDIAPLVAHHIAIISAREGRATVPRLAAGALEKLLAHRWPGNVRELINVLETALVLSPGDVIGAEHLHHLRGSANGGKAGARPAESSIPAYRAAKAHFEAEYYSRVLRAAHGNISLVAKLAQKTRKEVYDALRRAGLDADAYRDDDIA